jgi:hypothetical protein
VQVLGVSEITHAGGLVDPGIPDHGRAASGFFDP